jgi:hypothetical protein
METRTRRVIINKEHFTRILSRQALHAFKVFGGARRPGIVTYRECGDESGQQLRGHDG